MHEWMKGGTWTISSGVMPWTSKFLRSTLRRGNSGGVVDMLHSSWWRMFPSKCLSTHTPSYNHIPYDFATRNTKMQLSQFLSDWGKQGINGKVLKRRSQIWMEIEVLIKASYMASLLQSLRPRSEKMMVRKEEVMGRFQEVEKWFSSAHVGSFTTSIEEVMNDIFQRPEPCLDNSRG